jgi:hypothetical protein
MASQETKRANRTADGAASIRWMPNDRRSGCYFGPCEGDFHTAYSLLGAVMLFQTSSLSRNLRVNDLPVVLLCGKTNR